MLAKLLKYTAGLSSLVIVLGLTSCADEASRDDSTRSSDTKTEATPNADTATATPATPVKKKGRVTAKMEAGTKGEYKKDAKGVYSSVEVAPSYPGGEAALSDYISNALVYPNDALDRNIEGTVRVEFVVDEKGKVTNASSTGTALGNGLEQAAVDVINKMPDWTPGKVNGKNVKTRLILPVTYKLEE